MKTNKCILCKRRERKKAKPFCSHCYNKADIFKKMKAFRDNNLHTDNKKYRYNIMKRRKVYSRALRSLDERYSNEDKENENN